MSITKDKDGWDLRHPLRVLGDSTILPHELEGDGFVEWMILNGTTEEGYRESLKRGEEYLRALQHTGKLPLRTEQLTSDQRGWAMSEYREHFDKPMARWRRVSAKSNKVEPMKLSVIVRDRVYREACDDDKPKYVFWGTRWDGAKLYQCEVCGEVVIIKGRKN